MEPTKRKDAATATRESNGIKEGKVTKDEALRLALEALEFDSFYATGKQEAITAIKAVLLSRSDGEAKDEPVAWVYSEFWQHLENLNCGTAYRLPGIGRQPLYTTPPQRTWIELTNQELADCWATIPERAMRRVEAKLKEKNT
jgi:hypothetical protein